MEACSRYGTGLLFFDEVPSLWWCTQEVLTKVLTSLRWLLESPAVLIGDGGLLTFGR